MIEAGTRAQVEWGDGNWVFLDIGFARDARSCGLLVGTGDPVAVQFGEAARRIVSLIAEAASTVNLVVEAPLSVCFSATGNPKGRSIEKDRRGTRYWYSGLGCGVMIAAMYLVRDIVDSAPTVPVRLFEGFVSFKTGDGSSDHKRDVELLRNVVRDPVKYAGSIHDAATLKLDASDVPACAMKLAGIDYGIPVVLMPWA